MPTTNALARALAKRTPTIFGRYHLLGKIAMGGMAEVFVSRCGELLGMQTLIALKRILPVHAADEKFVQMFQREASIALRLQHRSIARVFEVGKVGNDWYLSLELVQGENLARVSDALEARGLHWDPTLIAFIASEVAQALHYAHTLQDARGRELKIVHRDISPENIMLGFDGSVKVIDFGIALCESYASLTTQGAVRGKVQYVSPEQAQTHKLDGRSDVFSLGVVLYECLAGSQPFERTSPMATLDAVVNKWVPPIPHVSQALNDAIIKALEKEPGRRYNSAEEFSTALLLAISGHDSAGPSKVSQLVTSLFPQRLQRWRQIQEMAFEGYGFTERSGKEADETPTPQPVVESADSILATKAEKYYVISNSAEPAAPTATPTTPNKRFTKAAGASLAIVLAAAVLFIIARAPEATLTKIPTTTPTANAAPEQNYASEYNSPRIVPLPLTATPPPTQPSSAEALPPRADEPVAAVPRTVASPKAQKIKKTSRRSRVIKQTKRTPR